jgi:hypothetical protein
MAAILARSGLLLLDASYPFSLILSVKRKISFLFTLKMNEMSEIPYCILTEAPVPGTNLGYDPSLRLRTNPVICASVHET